MNNADKKHPRNKYMPAYQNGTYPRWLGFGDIVFLLDKVKPCSKIALGENQIIHEH